MNKKLKNLLTNAFAKLFKKQFTIIRIIILFELFILLLISTTSFCTENPIPARFYNSTNGFAPAIVRTIIQDKEGFIWFGTDEGLIRFDGYSFSDATVFANDSQDYLFKDTRAIIEDPAQNLWVGTTQGLYILNNLGKVSEVYFNDYSLGYVSSLCILNNNELWVGTGDGIFVIDIKTKQILKNFNNPNSNTFVLKYSDQFVCSVTFSTVSFIESHSYKITSTLLYAEQNSIDDILVKAALDGFGNIWASKYSGDVYHIDVTNKKTIKHDIKKILNIKCGITHDFFLKSKDTLLFAIDDAGLFYFNNNKNTLLPYLTKTSTYPELPSNKFYALLFDRQQSLWIGIQKMGVAQLHKNINRFEHKSSKDNYGINYPQISSIMEDSEKKIWVGTDGGGLYAYNNSENQFTICGNNLKNFHKEPVLTLIEDSKNRIWAGTFRDGLLYLNKKGDVLKQYKNNIKNKNSLPCNDIRKIVEDKHGNLWLALQGMRLCKFNPTTEQFTDFTTYDKILGVWTMDILIDKNGMLWVGTSDGLSKQINTDFDFVQYSENEKNSKSLSNSFVNCIFEDKEGRVWIGTENGLNLYNKSANNFYHYTKRNGFKNTHIKSLIQDRSGMIWGGTNYGVFSLNPKTNSVTWFSSLDGMQESKFMERSVILQSNGKIAFGSSDGIIYVKPENQLYSEFTPTVAITSVKNYSNSLYPNGSNIINTRDSIKEMQLDFNTNNLTFEFTIFDFLQPQKNKFSYKLNGIDESFSIPTFDKKVNYASIPPGDYLFEVRASGINNLWSPTTSKFKIIINPPWYGTWWFKSLYSILIICVIICFYYWRVRSIREKNIFLDNEVKARTAELNLANNTKDKFFSIIAHDLKGPVKGLTTLIGMLKTETKETANENQKELLLHIDNSSKKIQNLILSLFEWAKTQTIGVKPNFTNTSLFSMVEDVKELLLVQASEKKLSIVNNVSKNLSVFCDTNMISTVIRNIISNSIKYTPIGKSIIITAQRDNNKIKLSIQDNGIGMNEKTLASLFSLDKGPSIKGTANESGTGLGLIIAKEFINLNGGEIHADSILGKGSTFNLFLKSE